MKSNQDYWKQREEQEKAWMNQNLADDKQFNELIAKHYNDAVDSINDKINQQYLSFAKRDDVTLADAKKAVSATDIKQFEAEAKSVVAQANKIRKQNGKVRFADFSDEVNPRMRLYNATMRINRLEMLKAQMGMEVVKANIGINDDLNQKLKTDYLDEITRQAGILGANKALPSLVKVSKIVSAQTGNATFSSRLWANGDALKNRLDEALTRQMIQGLNPRVIAKDLKPLVKDTVQNASYAAERLARTESARVQAAAQLDSFKRNGYEYCKWIAEPSACKVCLAIAYDNEGVYTTADVPVLPAHANCRCSLAAYSPTGKEPFSDLSSFKDYDSLDNDLKPLSGQWFNKLSEAERTNVKGYTGLAYKQLNEYLEGFSNEEFNDNLNKFSDNVSNAINKFKIPHDIHAYRSVSANELDYIHTHGNFNSFKSTGVNLVDVKEFKEDNYGSDIIHFYIPKNVHAAYLDGNGVIGDEGELLLDKNAKYTWRRNENGETEVMIIEK